MEEISELIRIVTAQTKKNLPLIDLKAQEDNENKELNLFLGVKNGRYDSDAAASLGIYGEETVDFKFRMLKSRLNRKLLNHLFFVDFGSVKAHKSVIFHQECLDFLHFSKMLLKLGEVKPATKLIYKTIDMARECEFSDILHEGLLALRDIFATTYRPKLFQSIQEEINENKLLLEKEEQASAIFFDGKLQLNSSLTNRKKDLKPLQKGLQKIKKLYDETCSTNIFIQYVKLSIWIFEQEGEFEASLGFIDALEKDLQKGKINEIRFDANLIRISKLYALLKLRRLSEGVALAEEYSEHFDREIPLWYAYMENYILITIRQKDYVKAAALVEEVIGNKTFNDLDEPAKEKWIVYAGYLYYLTGEKSLQKYFKAEALWKEIPEFQKDKAGLNVALLVLQLLSQLDRDLDVLRKILGALDDYLNKYLNNSFSKRTKLFYKLICKVTDHNRDFDMILKKSKYLVEKLSVSDTEGDAFADLEIVPYDDLWENILKRLSVLRFQSI